MSDFQRKVEERAKEIRARDEESKKLAFNRFMRDPLIRMSLADLPETNGKLETILRAVFESGWNSGAGHSAVEFMRALSSKS